MTLWKEDELKLIEYMRKNPQCIERSYSNLENTGLRDMWATISTKLNLPDQDCRRMWHKIKTKYAEQLAKQRKNSTHVNAKYLDGRFSFLDKYLVDGPIPDSQIESNIVVIDCDEDSDNSDLFTLDLTIIENLLSSRGETQENIEISGMDKISSILSRRIDETLSLFTKPTHYQINQVDKLANELKVLSNELSKDNETTLDGDVEFQDNTNFSFESKSPLIKGSDSDSILVDGNIKPAVVNAFPSSKDSCEMSIPVLDQTDDDNMETIFDIHSSSNSETFYRKLENYIEKFSKEKQEEIRLKICCLVTEIELEE